jgi:hypothetical protein
MSYEFVRANQESRPQCVSTIVGLSFFAGEKCLERRDRFVGAHALAE